MRVGSNWNSSVSSFTWPAPIAAIGAVASWSSWCQGGTQVCTSRYDAGGAVAAMGVGGVLLRVAERARSHLAEALHLRAGIVPRERWGTSP